MQTFPESHSPNPPNHLLGRLAAEQQLQPYLPLLNECIQFGWDAWKKDFAFKHHILSPRSRAVIIFDEIVARAMVVFSNRPGVLPRKKNNTFFLHVGDKIVIRFKKIGKNGKCSSIATRQQMLFTLQMQLPGCEGGTMVNAGYVLNSLQNEIADKIVVCEFAKRVLWHIPLTPTIEQNIGIFPASQPPAPSGPRFEAKQDAVAKKPKKKRNKRG
jgi:hypothetical protein